jgi:tetratricopeptide (TPR) repeat protein
MAASDEHSKLWTKTQTYTMAGICLILGMVVGYLAHSPEEARPSAPPAAVARPPAAPSGVNRAAPSPQDLKRMADEQAAPLLAELEKHPKNADLLAKIGRSYFAAQQFQSAQPYYERSVAVKANPDVLNELSFVYYSLGDVDRAIATLNRALKIAPKSSRLLFNLGMFQWHGRSDPKAAIAAWQDFLKANPNDPKRAEVEQMIAQAKQHLNIPPGTKTEKPAM